AHEIVDQTKRRVEAAALAVLDLVLDLVARLGVAPMRELERLYPQPGSAQHRPHLVLGGSIGIGRHGQGAAPLLRNESFRPAEDRERQIADRRPDKAK